MILQGEARCVRIACVVCVYRMCVVYGGGECVDRGIALPRVLDVRSLGRPVRILCGPSASVGWCVRRVSRPVRFLYLSM